MDVYPLHFCCSSCVLSLVFFYYFPLPNLFCLFFARQPGLVLLAPFFEFFRMATNSVWNWEFGQLWYDDDDEFEIVILVDAYIVLASECFMERHTQHNNRGILSNSFFPIKIDES